MINNYKSPYAGHMVDLMVIVFGLLTFTLLATLFVLQELGRLTLSGSLSSSSQQAATDLVTNVVRRDDGAKVQVLEQITVKLVAPNTPAVKGRPWFITHLTPVRSQDGRSRSCTVWTARRDDMGLAFRACVYSLAQRE